MWESKGDLGDGEKFSEKLMASTRGLIRKYRLDDEKIMKMCVKTQLTHTDGMTRWLFVSPERLASAMFDFDIGVDNTGSNMLHLDDEGGDHSVFLSLDLIVRVEFPLLALKKGIKDQEDEDAHDIGAEPKKTTHARRPSKAPRDTT